MAPSAARPAGAGLSGTEYRPFRGGKIAQFRVTGSDRTGGHRRHRHAGDRAGRNHRPAGGYGRAAGNRAGEAARRSQQPGVMHACGHDGHTAMLLASAKWLAQTRRFSGTVHFIFQPAEENLGGARKMVEEGLFQRFPMDAVYALHNWPGLPVGEIAVNSGAMMASLDSFDITLTGKSCHAAMPESGADPLVAAAQLIPALQTIPARRLSPLASSVVSVTQIQGGEAINVIPETVTLRGTVRCLQSEVRERCWRWWRRSFIRCRSPWASRGRSAGIPATR